ncbi:HAD family hydrolase [Paenibacillus alkalitolerans]|uniref:HAD family hydrolase n=1 Tax=Paenibacillus alkalitolerans TaxID=2799335 RepID=UPI0018F2EE6A|nr:HAD-IA family hydrolase [Paenibacillus alkalitolerans]
MFKAVVFDFDGTMLDTETVWYDSFRETLAEHDIDLPLEVFAHGIGTYDDSLFRYITDKMGSEDGLEDVKRRAFAKHHEKAATLPLRDGVEDYLKDASRLGLRIALATSSPYPWVESFLTSHGLMHYFETLCTKDDVAQVKPDPELYTLSVRRLGIEPHEAVAFEDSANGAKAAVAAGLRCVIVPNPVTEALHFEKYDMRIGSMKELSLEELLLKLS